MTYHGYHGDRERFYWPIRDYVGYIRATMEDEFSLEDFLESAQLLSKELSLSAGFLLESLQGTLNNIKTGRSPRVLKLEEATQDAEELLLALEETLVETEDWIKQLQVNIGSQDLDSEIKQDLENLGKTTQEEIDHHTQIKKLSENFLQRIQLIQDAEKLTNLGRAPIEEAWEEIAALLPQLPNK